MGRLVSVLSSLEVVEGMRSRWAGPGPRLSELEKVILVANALLIALVVCVLCVRGCEAEEGLASWYSKLDTLEVRNTYTAYNEKFDDTAMTCASLRYPYNTLLKVTNLDNGRSIVVRVNDRGPSRKLKGRIVDLTKAAFEKLANPSLGLIRVRVKAVGGNGGKAEGSS